MFQNSKIISSAADRPVPLRATGSLPARAHGLLCGTHVATETGWRAVETVTVGDLVLTADNQLKSVTQIGYRCPWRGPVPHDAWPVRVTARACGNAHTLDFLPDQAVILERGFVDAARHDRVTVPATGLREMLDLERVAPSAGTVLHTLFFAEDEAIYIDGGLIVPCPRSQSALLSASAGEATFARAA